MKRIWTYVIERGVEPPRDPVRVRALADEMRFGESVVVENEIRAQKLSCSIRLQYNARSKYKNLQNDKGEYRVWKLEKKELVKA